MANRKPLINSSGNISQIQSGDAVDPVAGGTGLTAYTTGDIPYASATNVLSKLPLGTALQQLRVNAGGTQIEWATGSGGGIATDPIWVAKGDTVAATGAAAAVRIPVGADGTNYQANAADSMGVGWSENSQVSKQPTANFTVFTNMSLVIAGTLTLTGSIRETMMSGSRMALV